MSDEEKQWKNRFSELAERAFARGRYAFTDFLSPLELNYFYRHEREFSYAEPIDRGGYEDAERRIVRFGVVGMNGYDEDFPISTVKIAAVSEKFAAPLTHRDYLGAVIGLGLERSTLGDIRVNEADRSAYLYCLDRIAPFIVDNLTRVAHTDVKCTLLPRGGEPDLQKIVLSEKYFLASARADCAVSAVFKLSRADAAAYFENGRAYINGRLCERASKELEVGDRVTVRGKGRFTFAEIAGESKKGRLCCRIERDG